MKTASLFIFTRFTSLTPPPPPFLTKLVCSGLLALFLVACSSGSSNSSTPDTSIQFNFAKAQFTIQYRDNLQISSNLIVRNIDKGTIRFNSDTTSVATIDSNGLLSIHGVGTATITAKRSIDSASAIELNATLSLTVTKGNQAPLAFEKIALSTGFIADSTKSNVASGGTGNGVITYSIDNTKVATIHPNTGIVTIKGRGTAKVTATKAGDANYNPISNSYELTVNNKRVQPPLSFASNEITLDYQAGGLKTTNTVSGGAGSGAITYRSDNTDIATVDNNGVVTIKSAGTLRIRATKAGDADYNPTEASYILTINKIAQSSFSFAKDVVTVAYEANKKISNPVQGGSDREQSLTRLINLMWQTLTIMVK